MKRLPPVRMAGSKVPDNQVNLADQVFFRPAPIQFVHFHPVIEYGRLPDFLRIGPFGSIHVHFEEGDAASLRFLCSAPDAWVEETQLDHFSKLFRGSISASSPHLRLGSVLPKRYELSLQLRNANWRGRSLVADREQVTRLQSTNPLAFTMLYGSDPVRLAEILNGEARAWLAFSDLRLRMSFKSLPEPSEEKPVGKIQGTIMSDLLAAADFGGSPEGEIVRGIIGSAVPFVQFLLDRITAAWGRRINQPAAGDPAHASPAVTGSPNAAATAPGQG